MDLRPEYFPLKVYKNDHLSTVLEFNLNGSPIDLQFATVLLQVRPTETSATVSLAITNGNGITITGDGKNQVSIYKLITIAAGEYVYDLQITYSSGQVKTYLYGEFIVSDDTSRP